jgi:regulator of protease activity HflC (stomatin/prohibitin superfamily)
MEQNAQRTGMVNWVTLLAVAVCSMALARYAHAAAGVVGGAFLGLGFLVAVVSYFQMRLAERERQEQLELEDLKKGAGGASLFGEAAGDTFPARRAREQFQRVLVPIFTVLLFLLQGGTAWAAWRWLRTAPPPVVNRATITLALYALFALVLFLLGKYSAGLARLDRQRLLRPGAAYLMLGSLVCCIVAVTEAAAWFGFPKVDAHVGRAFAVLLALTAAETLIGLVLEIYRPRVRGQEVRLLYESRLIGLLGQPGGLITTAAHALDYQFGFKVSETWVYKFLEKALAWIILLQLAAAFVSTTFVIIEPNEQGLLERFGRPAGGRSVLGPGLHFKWPWPIDRVFRYPTGTIGEFRVGVVPDADMEQERTLLWTRSHYGEEVNMLVASRDAGARSDSPGGEKPVPANLIVVSIPVHFQITNLVAWAYHHADSQALLERLANREVVRYLASADLDVLIGGGRIAAGETLRRRIQDRAQALGLGVQILFVGLQDLHPPIGNRTVPVAAAFEAVVGAMQQKQTNILAAQAYAAEKIPSAHAEATNLVARAQSQAVLKVQTAAAEATRFTNQLQVFRASPVVYTNRTYLEALVRAITPVRKYVLGTTNTQDILILNLEEQVRPDLLSGVILPPDATRPPAKTD